VGQLQAEIFYAPQFTIYDGATPSAQFSDSLGIKRQLLRAFSCWDEEELDAY
jgi:hypothetical protein